MTTALLVVDRSAWSVAASDEAQRLIENALTLAASVPEVIEDEKGQQRAVQVHLEVDSLRKQIEKARVAAKEQPLDLCRAIDARAKELTAELLAESSRIGGVLGDYQERLRRAAEAEARRLREEQERLERERQAELKRLADEAEAIARAAREKAAAEAAAARSEAEAKAAAERAEAEQKRLQAEAAAKAQAAQERVDQQVQALAPVAAPVKAEGQSVRRAWLWEVTDIHMLYRAHPNLVRLEENKSAIRELLELGVTNIKGLRAWQETKSGTRQIRQGTLIDV